MSGKMKMNGDTGSATKDEDFAKASSIASQLMGNPVVMEAIQSKLAGMVGEQSGYIQSLPAEVKRRVSALKKLQFEHTKIEAEFFKDIHDLECKYAERYAGLYSKRRDIINGDYEPTEEESEWPLDEEDSNEQAEPQDSGDAPIAGIPSFWSTTLKNVELLSSMIQEHDEPILDYLTDITVKYSKDPMGFTLEFHFDENDYFHDKVLTKWYEMRSAADAEDPFGFQGPEIVSCRGCKINWKEGKNVTISVLKKKQKNSKSGKERTVAKVVKADSFFNFFSPIAVPENEVGEDIDDNTASLIQADYEIGHFLRERIVSHAVLYFTGETILDGEDDDEDDEEGEYDSEEYDEQEDPDYDPSKDSKAAAGKQECKQQ